MSDAEARRKRGKRVIGEGMVRFIDGWWDEIGHVWKCSMIMLFLSESYERNVLYIRIWRRTETCSYTRRIEMPVIDANSWLVGTARSERGISSLSIKTQIILLSPVQTSKRRMIGLKESKV